MSTKELQENLIESMKTWQKIEDAAIAATGEVIEKSENPLIRLVMEIIRNDSRTHHKVQAFIASTFTDQAVTLSIDDLAGVWDAIEKHNETEKKMLSNVAEALESLKGKKMLVQEYLLNYLKEDETKHNRLLGALEEVKKGIYPYA